MIDRMFEDAAQVDDGEVANYIPQLAKLFWNRNYIKFKYFSAGKREISLG